MRKNIATAAGVITASLVFAVSMTGSAQAGESGLDSGIMGCGTDGAYGDMSWTNYWGPGSTINLRLSVTDIQSDGYGVGVRFLSKDTWGKIHYWAWHKNSQGYGKTSYWDTTASHTNGLFDIGIQIARFNSDGTVKNYCTKW